MWKFWKSLQKDESGTTLVEMAVVLVILGILMSIAIPSLTGYIDKAKEKKYTMEAQGVKQSVELYLLDQYGRDGIDAMELMENLSMYSLKSRKCVLKDYLKVTCTEGARIQNMTLERGRPQLYEMVYLVDDYEIDIRKDEVLVERKD